MRIIALSSAELVDSLASRKPRQVQRKVRIQEALELSCALLRPPPDRSDITLSGGKSRTLYHTGLTMRVFAIILALAAGASGCPCSSNETEEQCRNTCEGCVWQEPCEGTKRRNLRFGVGETGCCTYENLCNRRLTTEEMAALTAEEQERRRLC